MPNEPQKTEKVQVGIRLPKPLVEEIHIGAARSKRNISAQIEILIEAGLQTQKGTT